jgi:hypothetical protein
LTVSKTAIKYLTSRGLGSASEDRKRIPERENDSIVPHLPKRPLGKETKLSYHSYFLKHSLLCFVIAFSLTACGEGGSEGVTNQEPVAIANATKRVLPGSKAVLDGSSSHDTDGSIVSYQWKQKNNGSPIVELLNADSVSAQFVAPETDKKEELAFELTVRDDGGAQNSDVVDVTLLLEPIVNAGPDQSIAINPQDTVTVVLNGSSSDAEGKITDHQWRQTGGPDATLQGATTQTATFTAPSETEAYSFSYTVTDVNGVQSTDTVSIYTSKILFFGFFRQCIQLVGYE